MPEMLWAVLLTGVLVRTSYLDCFRRIAILCREWFLREEGEGEGDPPNQVPIDDGTGFNFTVVVDHTKLAEVDDEAFRKFLAIPLSHPLGYAALRPLLLIKGLPGIERWRRELDAVPTSDDWTTLGRAIAGVLDHQSEASTDIRWFKVILPVISGNMYLPASRPEFGEELRLYPDMGDMRSVRPTVRSMEMTLRRNPSSTWVVDFWNQAFEETKCIDPTTEAGYPFTAPSIDPRSLYSTRDQIISMFTECMTANRADARLDSSFGLVLYALSMLEEIGLHRIQTRISGHIVLRALAEGCITLGYLAHRDELAIWQAYRVYGAGQAKLAFLKVQEAGGELPSFLDESALFAIANEDVWQEFLNIDVGHWANSNLRKLAMDSGMKEVYDKYYDWSSTYIHATWGAVRDTNFVTCHNPLHRLHRIPRLGHRQLNSIEPDAISLVNQMISILEGLYPGKASISPIKLTEAQSVSPATQEESRPKEQ
jgi:hypothetical protein